MTDQTQTTTEPVAWETAADNLCGEMLKQAPGQVRKVADALYETLLDTVQDYLRDNVGYNLSGELRRAKDNEATANEALKSVALAMGIDVASFPHWPTPAMLSEQCVKKHSDALALAAPADGWQGIETAPKDGTEVLLWSRMFAGEISGPVESHGPIIGSFGDGLSDFAGNEWWDVPSATYSSWCIPTHWMPLPAAPTGGRS